MINGGRVYFGFILGVSVFLLVASAQATVPHPQKTNQRIMLLGGLPEDQERLAVNFDRQAIEYIYITSKGRPVPFYDVHWTPFYENTMMLGLYKLLMLELGACEVEPEANDGNCHGYTFGNGLRGFLAPRHALSILADDYYPVNNPVPGDIFMVFKGMELRHSGAVTRSGVESKHGVFGVYNGSADTVASYGDRIAWYRKKCVITCVYDTHDKELIFQFDDFSREFKLTLLEPLQWVVPPMSAPYAGRFPDLVMIR